MTNLKEPKTTKSFNRSLHGLVNGYRSGLEDKIAEELKARGIPPRYETIKIRYTKPEKSSYYKPDFPLAKRTTCPVCHGQGKIEDMDCWLCEGDGRDRLIVESKGIFDSDDRLKHLEIKKQHPYLDIRFVFSRSQKPISKKSKTTYASWCEKHGFLYADKQIPESWLQEVRNETTP